MNLKKFLLVSSVSIILVPILTSCDKNDDPEPSPVTVSKGAYILNSGIQGNNAASISYYDFGTQSVSQNVFETQNGRKLGEIAQDMVIYGSKMYISVSISNVINFTDLNCKVISSIEPIQDGQPQIPRSLLAYGGKVYVTMQNGYLARIDTTTLKITQQVKVGRNPEGLVAVGNKIYVADSGGMDWETGYNNTVSVVDINTFTVSKTIQVVTNPNNLVTDKQGDVYLISWGNYGTIPFTFQRIDTKTDQVQTVTTAKANMLTSAGDKLYMIYNPYGTPQSDIKYIIYDAVNEKVLTENFITDGTVLSNPYCISHDPSTGYIYVGDSPRNSTGDMYVFSSAGKLVKKFDTGGYFPMGAYFVLK